MATQALWGIGEFLTAFLADVVYGAVSGKPKGGAKGDETPGSKLGSQLKGSIFGLTQEEEAAFLQALSLLSPADAVKIAEFVKSLGDPDKTDTPEARVFRSTIVKLEDAEARLKVLQALANLDNNQRKLVAEITGAAVTGDFVKLMKLFKDAGTQVVGKLKALINKAKGLPGQVRQVDQDATAGADSLRAKIQVLTTKMNQRP